MSTGRCVADPERGVRPDHLCAAFEAVPGMAGVVDHPQCAILESEHGEALRLCSKASTSATSPTSQRAVSKSCIVMSTKRLPSRSASPSWCGGMRLRWAMRSSCTAPMRPESMCRFAAWKSGSKRRWKPTWRQTPVRLAAARRAPRAVGLERERLLAEDVHPRSGGALDQLRVERRGNGDDHRRHVRIGEGVVVVGRPVHVELASVGLRQLRQLVDHHHEPGARELPDDVPGVEAADRTHADHREADHRRSVLRASVAGNLDRMIGWMRQKATCSRARVRTISAWRSR